MKIKSEDNEYYLEIEDKDIDGISYVDVTAKFGHFSGSNNSVYLDNLSDFISDLDAFIADRALKPKLTGTYDFELVIYSKSSGGHPWVKVNVGNSVTGRFGNSNFGVYGEFELDGEFLLSYLESFRGLV